MSAKMLQKPGRPLSHTPILHPSACRNDNHTPATLRAAGCCTAAGIFTELCLGWGGYFPVSAGKYIIKEIKTNIIN